MPEPIVILPAIETGRAHPWSIIDTSANKIISQSMNKPRMLDRIAVLYDVTGRTTYLLVNDREWVH